MIINLCNCDNLFATILKRTPREFVTSSNRTFCAIAERMKRWWKIHSVVVAGNSACIFRNKEREVQAISRNRLLAVWIRVQTTSHRFSAFQEFFELPVFFTLFCATRYQMVELLKCFGFACEKRLVCFSPNTYHYLNIDRRTYFLFGWHSFVGFFTQRLYKLPLKRHPFLRFPIIMSTMPQQNGSVSRRGGFRKSWGTSEKRGWNTRTRFLYSLPNNADYVQEFQIMHAANSRWWIFVKEFQVDRSF